MLKVLQSPLLRQYAVVIIANFSVLCTGLNLAWPSPVLVKLSNTNETIFSRPITEEEGSWIVSIGFLVAIFFSFLPAVLLDRIGRKQCIILSSVPKVVMCLIFTFATEIWMLMLGRALGAVADIFSFTVVPTYASEVASKEIRGALGTILQILCSLGILMMLSIGPFTPYVTLNAIFTGIVVILSIPLLFLPDSPYFLHSKGRTEEALNVLTFLRGSEALAQEEIKEYSFTNDIKPKKIDIIKNRQFLKAFGIVLVLNIGSQLIGFNAVTFYLQTVLESTETSVRPEIASVIIGCIQLLASFCTTLVTDKFGRKPILGTTLAGTAVGMIGLGIFFRIKESEGQISGFMNYLPLISLILVVFCYSAGPGSVNWPLCSELFDGPSRAMGLTLAGIIGSLTLFLTLKYFALLTTALGPSVTYWMFSVNCILFCMFVLFCIPETKGRSFAEIQDLLGQKKDRPEDA
ncbi:facilitated trehalose transporter Tret1-like [Galleria mellonella]|uniref:Facilitated trehalose transporter Tret1-like n=1 Tax=Galleria mellonella TaxID=7137 RepID=A0A6J1WIE7_GALME|nr:facilitated trehalose transporter Tret1-like [Galleria mellonella]